MPDFALEAALIEQGHEVVAGVDEAGRGPLAGPVVAAAVVLNPEIIPAGLNDSKKLSAARREALFEEICGSAFVSVVSAPPDIILARNIRGATLWAMARAVAALPISVGHALIDGRDIPPELDCPAQAVIGGDGKSFSIAAASIVAKVMRDRACAVMELDCPEYGFAAHKGYGTAQHMAALEMHGPTAHHRAGFAPVAALLQRFNPNA